MRKIFTLLLLLLLPTLILGQSRPATESRPIVFTHATVIDATGAAARPDISIVVAGGRIVALGKTGRVRIPVGAEVINATGKFLIPGLWDMHIHSGGYENGKKFFPGLIANGITGVRDMGTPLDEILRLRKEVDEGKIPGPRMVIAGPLVQGPLPFKMPVFVSVNNEAEARQAVISLKDSGVDFIKVQDALPRDLYFAVAAEAKRQKIPFAGHTPPFITAPEASNAGQRSVEHLGGRFYGVLLACSAREAELTGKVRAIVNGVMKALNEQKEPDDSAIFRAGLTKELLESFSERKAAALFSTFLKNQTWQVPTLVAQPLRQAIEERKDLSEEDIRYGKKLLQKQLDLVGAMQRAGVKIMAGTDFPPERTRLYEELSLLVEAGLTPMEALQSATRNPAAFLGRLDSLGTIERGKIADLVLLDANPLEDIGNVRKVNAVVFGGKLFPKTTLETMRTND
jgi:imidazolonepropionase-like amidohydrolase